jgi:type II secretory pathway component PulF
MPMFKYKAVDSKGGNAVEILIEGDSKDDSLARLRGRGFTPIKFIGQVDDDGKSFSNIFARSKKFDTAEFTNRLLPLLKAQIQLERALGIIANSSEDDTTKSVVVDLRRGLHEGKKFSGMIRDRGNYFPPVYANMVEAGEESGALTKVMEELQKFLNERKELRNFLITSLIYPSIILSVTAGVVILLFTVFIPKFSKIFIDMGRELPLPTKIMMGISNLVTNPIMIMIWIACIFGIFYFIARVRTGGKAKEWWDSNILNVPFLGSVLQTIEIARFIRTMAVLLQSYVPLMNAVTISQKVIQNARIRDTLSGITGELRAGTKLSSALSKSAFISKTVVQMLNIGEETGNLGEMLAETASYYETEVKNRIQKLLALFEPLVILVLAAVVMAVVGSIFMAMLELNNI